MVIRSFGLLRRQLFRLLLLCCRTSRSKDMELLVHLQEVAILRRQVNRPQGGLTDGATNVKWCTQIARNLSEARESRSTPLHFLVHDQDHRFGEPFDEMFKAEGVETIRTPWRAPRANAYAERFVRTVRTECLDRIFILSERHLESVLKTYINHDNRERPHRGLNLRIPEGGPSINLADATGSICAVIAPRWPYPRILSLSPRVRPLRCSTRRESESRGPPKRTTSSLSHQDGVVSLFRVRSRQVILRAVGDRSSDDTLQVQFNCGELAPRTRHEGPFSAPRKPVTWTFPGADDGV
jgi:Integrase core domain